MLLFILLFYFLKQVNNKKYSGNVDRPILHFKLKLKQLKII